MAKKNKSIVLSAKQVRALDKYAIKKIGVPEIVLMENAGVGVFRFIKQRIPDYKKKSYLILAGAGNNGGDAMVVARHLKNQGIDLKILLVGAQKRMSDSARHQMRILKKMKVKVKKFKLDLLKKYLKQVDICLDGILGTGFRQKLREPVLSIIEHVNKAKVSILAIDFPSGLNADTGKPSPIAIDADWTITLGAYKHGLFTQSSKPYVGKLHVVDIGLPIQQWLKRKK